MHPNCVGEIFNGSPTGKTGARKWYMTLVSMETSESNVSFMYGSSFDE